MTFVQTGSNMGRWRWFSLAAFGSVLLMQTGCLQTRAAVREQEEKQVLQKTVKNLQQSSADVSTRFQDIDEDLRRLSGRVEVAEMRLNQVTQKTDKTDQTTEQRLKEMSDRLTSYHDAITKLDSQVAEMGQTIAQLQEEMRKAPPAAVSGGNSARPTGPYANAEALFKSSAWKEAILEYEKYRKSNAKGKQFADATYKIGVCFQELGLSDDAKAFYEEVVAKFPKSKEAEKAAYRLKVLKKK